MKSNKDVVRAFLQALGKGDVPGLKAVLTTDAKAICTGTSLLSKTRDYAEICATAGALGQIAPKGIDFRILTLTAEEDRVSAEVEGYSTLVNGAAYNNQYHFLFFIRDGKVYLLKEYIDTKLADATLAPLFQAA